MPRHLILAAVAGLMILAQGSVQGQALSSSVPEKRNAILCETEDQAIVLATTLASGKTEPIAINIVNKSVGAEVCGRYIGYAVVEIEKTRNRKGGLFMLAGLRFVEDGRLGWTANWIRPFDGSNLARGI